MATTAVYTCIAELYKALQTTASGARVSNGWPVGNLKSSEVWIPGQVRDWTRQFRDGGRRMVDESFTIPVVIFMQQAGTLPDTEDLVEAVLEAAESLAPSFAVNAEVTGGTFDSGVGDDGRTQQVAIELLVSVRADSG